MRLLSFASLMLVLAACQTGRIADQDRVAAEIIRVRADQFCTVSTNVDGYASQTKPNQWEVLSINRGRKNWIMGTIATGGAVDNVYYNIVSSRTICGAKNFEIIGYDFDK